MEVTVKIRTSAGMTETAINCDRDRFYQIAAELMTQNPTDKAEYTYITPDGIVSYLSRTRSGTQFITETENTLPTSYLDHAEHKYLCCADYLSDKVNSFKNRYKFYELIPQGNELLVRYGRIGVPKGQAFGPRTFKYPISMYYCKMWEKLSKGYEDFSDPILCEDTREVKVTDVEDVKQAKKKFSPSSKLFRSLLHFSKDAVARARVSVPVNTRIIEKSKEYLEQLRQIKSVDEFNAKLVHLMCISQRPLRTGDGTGVKSQLAETQADFAGIIDREESLIQSMEGVRSGVSDADFGCNIEVYIATEMQRKQVLRHLSPALKDRVKTIYRIIPKRQKAFFNGYVKKNDISPVKLLWHGSRNENWISIIQNSLSLTPNAVITGKMFGSGIYFAPSSMKSWGYTSAYGSRWANGSSDTAYMGLYAVAYGKPHNVDTWSPTTPYESIVKKNGCNCLHAHAGVSLKNDEIVFYNESAILLNYIVEFTA